MNNTKFMVLEYGNCAEDNSQIHFETLKEAREFVEEREKTAKEYQLLPFPILQLIEYRVIDEKTRSIKE